MYKRQVGIIISSSYFGTLFRRATWHDKELPDIVPIEPDREQTLTVVNPIVYVTIDVDDVLDRLSVSSIDGDAIYRQLVDTLPGYVFRHTDEALHIVTHRLINILVVALKGCAQHTQVSNNTGIFVLLEFLVPFHFRRLILIYKNASRDADEICKL